MRPSHYATTPRQMKAAFASRVILRGPDGLYRGLQGARVDADHASSFSPAEASWLKRPGEVEEPLWKDGAP